MPSLPPSSGPLPDRLRGALLGLAAGDRNGGPLRMALCLAADFHQALGHPLPFAGPANYCPVLAGAFAGARWGASAIGPDLMRHPAAVGLLPRVEQIADDLARTWEGPFLAAPAPRG